MATSVSFVEGIDDQTDCECGIPLAAHPPLPAPGPLNRWRAERIGSSAVTWNGHERQAEARPPAPPDVIERRTAANRQRAAIAYRNTAR